MFFIRPRIHDERVRRKSVAGVLGEVVRFASEHREGYQSSPRDVR
jgi:hypothetical protein